MANPRKNSYGQTLRVDIGINTSNFTDITLNCSASSNGGFSLNLSASTLFSLNSTVYSSTEGLTFNSAEAVYGLVPSGGFATADNYTIWVDASGSGLRYISPTTTITVDA